MLSQDPQLHCETTRVKTKQNEKRPPFLQFSLKLSEIFFGERSKKFSSFFFNRLLLGAFFFC
jgi:hypothetical protein